MKNLKSLAKTKLKFLKFHLQWTVLGAICSIRPRLRCTSRLLIIPSDPWSLIGAKGDEAMMSASVQYLKKFTQVDTVGVLVATPAAAAAARTLGFDPLNIWDSPLTEAVSLLSQWGPRYVVVLGADVMDGYYGPETATKMLALADLAVRNGARGTVLGFSFNEKPNALMRRAFESLSPALALNVRDAISLGRFTQFCGAHATLVADSAFLLPPASETATVTETGKWAAARRAEGHRIFAFNIHPMLVKDANAAQVRELVEAAVDALETAMKKSDSAFLLLSHDYRERIGDDTCLYPIFHALRERWGQRVAYPTERMSAGELKAIAGLTDGVITGRMHLAIAAFGMGVPVAALTYQDKFQGLYRHFDFPEKYLLPPDRIRQEGCLAETLIDFISDSPRLKSIVCDRLPKIKARSEGNFTNLVGENQPRDERAC